MFRSFLPLHFLGDFLESCGDFVVVFFFVRERAVFAGFYPFFGKEKVSVAFFAEAVERAEAEKAVEILFFRRFVARKVLAF